MPSIITLKIADVIIALSSRQPMKPLTDQRRRFQNFLYRGRQTPHIRINVRVVKTLPSPPAGIKDLFVTIHFQDRRENWRWQQQGNRYFFRCPLEEKHQLGIVNARFDRATLYLQPKHSKRAEQEERPESSWDLQDVIYDFLQILLIQHLALRDGIFVHGIGLRDLGGNGLLFAGKSGAGKSTTARLWHKHTRAMILNDDRIIVRKQGRRYRIYGTPWHGDFSDYLESKIESAPLTRLFFLHHANTHRAVPLAQLQAFQHLYPCLFPPFWERAGIDRIVSFCQQLVVDVPVARLGFAKDRSVIPFVRALAGRSAGQPSAAARQTRKPPVAATRSRT